MQQSRRSFLLTSAAAAGAAATISSASRLFAAEERLRLTIAASHPITDPPVTPLKSVIVGRTNAELEKLKSNYRIDWTEAYGGALYNFRETLEAVSGGVTDIGWIGSIFVPARLPLQNIMYATLFSTNSVRMSVNVMNELNDKNSWFQKEWAENKVVFFGACVADGYHLMTKFPVSSLADFKGKKIVGAAAVAPWIEALGAAPVGGALPTFYSQLQTGVADGAVIHATGAWPLKLHEVVPYLTLVDTGPVTYGGVGMNAASFAKMPPDVQKVLRQLGRAYSEENVRLVEEGYETAIKGMTAAGAKITKMPESDRKKWAASAPPMGKLWVNDNEKRGIPAREILTDFMNTVRAHGGKPLRDWDKET
ncbi:MAG: C4-dicarboxylate TRAP transporter substrate-binding protein [Bradyrhizobiaceae bacterium]|nr:C4-dicarboxylate TRAP transporter substrate-binding protein [Bradyrhizobiaceae bacterium]